MKVGDLVKHSGMNDVVWFGTIIKEKPVLKTKRQGNQTYVMKYFIEWTFGDGGWFWHHQLEAV